MGSKDGEQLQMLGRVKMQHTSCTEDRIQHALDRCLDGLQASSTLSQSWNTGWCMNRWSLEELLRRDPENFLILLQQILTKARQVQEENEYELVAPLAIMFESTLIQTPHCPLDSDLLAEACEVFHGFLTWPEPYSNVCCSLLSTIQQELRAPGISYHRLVREEQGLAAAVQSRRTITVMLLNPADVPASFLSVLEQMSGAEVSRRDSSITLIKHAFQSTLGTKYPLPSIHTALQSLGEEEMEQAVLLVTELLESASAMPDVNEARSHVAQGLEQLKEKLNIPGCDSKKMDGMLQILRVPTAKCYTIRWDTDNFDVLNELLESEPELASIQASEVPAEEDEVDEDVDEEEDLEEMEEFGTLSYMDPRASMFSTVSSLSTASKDSMFSTYSVASSECSPLSTLSSSSQASGTDSDFCEEAEEDSPVPPTSGKPKSSSGFKRLSRLFKAKSSHSLCRAKSLGNAEAKDILPSVRSKRSNSVPQQALLRSSEVGLTESLLMQQALGCVRYRRRPILSSAETEEPGATLLRVLVFGADHVAGRVARAYSSLRRKERDCPRLSKAFRLRFFFVPVRRDPPGNGAVTQFSASPLKASQDVNMDVPEHSTNDIATLLGMLDPWYERNTLCLLDLPLHIVCKQTSKPEPELLEDSAEDGLPILADLLLYYCRNATRPALVQLYQAELTLAGGEIRTEVFVHSLELGHTAGTRAIKAMGAASKRFGIDGDREAVPLSLEVVYNQVVISGRNQKTRAEKVCTSVNLIKACRNAEELDPKIECLQLTMTEVLKRQNSKSKKSFNQQLSTTRAKVDKVRVCGSGNTTFAVCLDQDEKKILQSVTRCEVSVCYKPDSSANWPRFRTLTTQVQPLQPTFCSLLCLPISTFSGPQP
ncbi:phosphoinositide 3-kinase regulatory subunit 5 isoform X1 [Astyanax mexicanus]|uniref:phosphoinositide 3-kinase regulatory subunit 5 isoform X1 n=2 Tax=Astyanax mexicanus TaxID=7994 RepID=UPI0020CB6410|nr:phosphoinositide 3-kinase regulatory subunit 5 isoform X1 [Astyanax mexicanus]